MKFGLWLGLAIAVFLMSAWLMLQITTVGDQTVFDLFRHNVSLTEDAVNAYQEHAETLYFSVMFRNDEIDNSADNSAARQALMRYRSRASFHGLRPAQQLASVEFQFPASNHVKLYFSNGTVSNGWWQCLTDPKTKPAEADRTVIGPDDNLYFSTRQFYDASGIQNGLRYTTLSFNPSSDDKQLLAWVTCYVSPNTKSVTFTRNATNITYSAPGERVSSGNILVSNGKIIKLDRVVPASEFSGFSATKAVLALAAVDASDNLSVEGGFKDSGLTGSDHGTLLLPKDDATIEWDNLALGQIRDIILVLIGTLTALGVTFVVEALHSLIDERPRDEEHFEQTVEEAVEDQST